MGKPVVFAGLSGGRPIPTQRINLFPAPESCYLGSGLSRFTHSRSDASANAVAGAAKRIISHMRISCGDLRARVPEQLADQLQPDAASRPDAGVRMSEVMNADALEPGLLRYQLPRPLEIGAGFFGVIAGHDIGTYPLKIVENADGGCIQDHEFGTDATDSLVVRQFECSLVKIDINPPCMKDFPKAAAGQDQ